MTLPQNYEVIVIGGSYAGLAAAMTLGRSLRKTLVIDGGQPCNRWTPHSHNFLTNDGKPPLDILMEGKRQVAAYATVHFYEDYALNAQQQDDQFLITTNKGDQFLAEYLVLATGVKDQWPSIDGFEACWGKSVLHCPYCHGYEVKNQKTGILANGDMGYDFVQLISQWTSDITLFTHGKSTLSQDQTNLLHQRNIEVIEGEVVAFDHQEGQIQYMVMASGLRIPLQALYARVPFIQHSDLAEQLGCAINAQGYIEVDTFHQTSLPKVFACGDNSMPMRSVANAVAGGHFSGAIINKKLIKEFGKVS